MSIDVRNKPIFCDEGENLLDDYGQQMMMLSFQAISCWEMEEFEQMPECFCHISENHTDILGYAQMLQMLEGFKSKKQFVFQNDE